MIRQTLASPAIPSARPGISTTRVQPSVQLSAAEKNSISGAFPERPSIVQRLYGSDREVQNRGLVGGQLDLSA